VETAKLSCGGSKTGQAMLLPPFSINYLSFPSLFNTLWRSPYLHTSLIKLLLSPPCSSDLTTSPHNSHQVISYLCPIPQSVPPSSLSSLYLQEPQGASCPATSLDRWVCPRASISFCSHCMQMGCRVRCLSRLCIVLEVEFAALGMALSLLVLESSYIGT
jgi:hypothetical protein